MNTPAFRPDDEESVERADLDRDVVAALGPLDEAVDVTFLAIKGAQQAARSVPDTASPTRFREEWHTANVLVRQALRLVDERVQDLAKAIKRLPRNS
jgi:hypothetical protein